MSPESLVASAQCESQFSSFHGRGQVAKYVAQGQERTLGREMNFLPIPTRRSKATPPGRLDQVNFEIVALQFHARPVPAGARSQRGPFERDNALIAPRSQFGDNSRATLALPDSPQPRLGARITGIMAQAVEAESAPLGPLIMRGGFD